MFTMRYDTMGAYTVDTTQPTTAQRSKVPKEVGDADRPASGLCLYLYVGSDFRAGVWGGMMDIMDRRRWKERMDRVLVVIGWGEGKQAR